MDLKEFKQRFEHKPVIEEPNLVAQNPLVSVCVQTYQHVRYIKQCLDGILMQKTNFDFEILLGEDASIDGTREICKEYAKKFPDRIRLFLHHRENNIAIGGSPTGRFILMTNLFTTRGKYIALCEGDDYWTDPYKLQKQVDFLESNPDYVITFHDVTALSTKNEVLLKGRLKNDRQVRLKEDLVIGAHLPTPTVCFRNVIKTYPKEFNLAANGDTFLFAILGHFGKGYRHFDITNSIYRVHSGGIWSGRAYYDKLLNGNNTFKQILKVSDRKFSKPLYRKLMSIQYNLMKKAPKLGRKVSHLCELAKYSYMYLNKGASK